MDDALLIDPAMPFRILVKGNMRLWHSDLLSNVVCQST